MKKFVKSIIFLLFFIFISLVVIGLLIGDKNLPIVGLIIFAFASGLATIYSVLNQT